MGASRSQVHKLEMGERRMTVDWMFKIASALDCIPVDLLPEDSKSPSSSVQGVLKLDLPVYDFKKAISFEAPYHTGLTLRPTYLLGSKEGFATYMPDQTMTPRFYAGELLFVQPEAPVLPSSYALLEFKSGVRRIVQITKLNETTIYFRRFFPASKDSLDRRELSFIHRIIGTMHS